MNYSFKRSRSVISRARLTGLLTVLCAGFAFWVIAQDADNDGMSDYYEIFFGLNATNPADAAFDNDGDSLTNLAESAFWTDPYFEDTDRDGWPDSVDSHPVSRAYIDWGSEYFTISNDYEYTAPMWWIAAYKVDGQWTTNPSAWHVGSGEGNGVGRLNVEVDRAYFSNNLVMDVSLYDHPGASLFVNLYDTNYTIVASNLFGNLLAGTDQQRDESLLLPFGSYPEAVGIALSRGSGEITVYESLLYMDEDRDGLDVSQEQQLGTSDADTDSDDDGLDDYAEVFTHGTDPALSDTDGDGMSDQWEVEHGFNALVNEAGSVPSAGLRLWLRADSVEGGAVALWSDESGLDNDVTQSDSQRRPLCVTNAVNGLPAVAFDGSNDFLAGAMGTLIGDVSVIVISRFNQLNQAFLDYDYVLNVGVDTAWQQLSVSRCADGYDPDWNDRYYARVGPEPVAGSFNGPVLMGQKWLCIDAVHASGSAGHSLRLNGMAREVEQYEGTLLLNGVIDLGRYSKPGYDNHYLDGQIAEILVYNRALTSYERDEVEAYLKAKYAFNSAPEVDAGQDQQINEGQSAELEAVITDDGVPGLVTSLWSKVSGPGDVTFSAPSATDSTVEFGECGAYVLRLTAYDGEYETSDEMVVTVLASLSTNVPSEGLRLWLKADDMPLSDGDSVSSWLDRSGLGNHLNQSTVDRAPVYRVDAVNGLPAIEFDGTDDSLAGAIGAVTGNVSLIVVCRFNELHQVQDDYEYVLNIGEDTAWKQVSISRCAEGYAAGWDDAYYARLGTGAGSFPGPVLPGQKWLYIATVHSTTGVAHSVRLNGTSQSATQYSEALDLNGQIELGRFSKPGYDNHYLRGQVAETLVYDRALSASELEGIEAYLGSKYYPINAQPEVDAGEDQEILETQSAVLDGAVTDDGQPIVPGVVTSQWSKVNGPGMVTFNDASSPATSASFETTGAYLLRLTAYDGEYETSDDIQVMVSAALSTNVPSSGLRLWLKADELALDNGDAVLTWTDRSGQGHDMTQATQANAPVYATNVVGGRAAVVFDGANDYLGGGLGGMTGDVSIITVFRFDQLSQPQNDYEYVLNMGEDVAWKQVSISRCAVGYDAAWDDAYYARLGQGAGSFVGPVLAGQEWMVLCAVHSTNGVSHSVWVDGYPMSAQQYEGTLQLDGKIELGRFSKPGYANHYLDGGIAEVMVYNRALDAEEIGNVGQYLSTKYDTDWYTDPQVTGEITYSGPQEGAIHVFACTNGTDFICPQTTNLLNPGPYLITLADAGDYWLHAYRDSNGNASNDFWEAQGSCAGNPVEVNGSIENLDITLTDPDTDSDGLPDWWEILHFGDLDETAEGDPDSDGLNNLAEYQYGTDPNNADTDSDGMTDGWEVDNGFNPTVKNLGDVMGWWKLDETSGVIAADSINAKHGVISGGEHVPGQSGYGLKFDGYDDEVSVTNSGTYKPQALTVSLRMKLDDLFGNTVSGSAPDGFMVLLAQKNAANGYAYAIYKTEHNALAFEIAHSSGTNTTIIESGACFVYTGEWFHVVGTFDGTDAALYANGERIASSSHESALDYDAGQGLTFGHGTLADDGYFNGVLDDVLILDVALESEEIAALSQVIGNPDTDDDGLFDFDELFIYKTDPNNADSDGDGLSDYDEIMTTGTDPNSADTDADNLTDAWEIAYGLNPTNMSAAQLVGWWKLDEAEGTSAGDTSASGNDGLVIGAEAVPGAVAMARGFDGSDDGIVITNASNYKPANQVSVAAFVKFDGLLGNTVTNGAEDGRMILLAQKNAGAGYGYALYKSGDHKLVFEVANSAQTNSALVSTSVDYAHTGEWVHVVGTFNGSSAALYVNAELIGTATYSAPLEYDAVSGLKLGYAGFGADGRFAGALDDVRVYAVALSAEQCGIIQYAGLDGDNDGLSNYQESIYGTNPNSGDSDSDGLPDKWEAEHGLDPLDDGAGGSQQGADGNPQGDGLSNLQKYELGLDPRIFYTVPGNAPSLMRQVWWGIPSQTISQFASSARFPYQPDEEYALSGTNDLFEAPVNIGDNYGERMFGRLLVPLSGEYTFWIASDNSSELWITIDGNRQRIAQVDTWTSPRQWDKFASQRSAPIYLEAGKRYTMDALMIETSGDDNLAVAMQFPNGAFEGPIRASRFNTGFLSGAPDTDADGMPDAWENAHGLNPMDAADAQTDEQGDGLTNLEKFLLGLDPGTFYPAPENVPSLTRQVWWGIPGSRVLNLVSSMKFPYHPDVTYVLDKASDLFEAPERIGDNFGQRMFGRFYPPLTGEYTFWVASDNQSELWITIEGVRQRIVRMTNWTAPREWDKFESQRSAPVYLEAGQSYPMEALMKEDNKGDNLSVAVRFPNGRVEAPMSAAWFEAPSYSWVDPTLSLSVESRTTNIQVNGSAAIPLIGSWAPNAAGSLVAQSRNGEIEFTVNIASAGVYGAVFVVEQGHVASTRHFFNLSLRVNGRNAGVQQVDAPRGQPTEAFFITPYLEGGTNRFALKWNNLLSDSQLSVHGFALVTLDSEDANENGIADWLEEFQHLLLVAEPPLTSPVSPVCVEGMGLYHDTVWLTSSAGDPQEDIPAISGPRGSWFADLPLDPVGSTIITWGEDYTGTISTGEVNWTETNLLPEPEEPIMIRRGDALRLIARPESETNGTVTIDIAGVTNYVTSALAPVPHEFGEAGDYTLVASWAYESQYVQVTALVHVVTAAFNGSPLCVVGRSRDWNNPGLSDEAVIDRDARMVLTEAALDPEGRTLTLRVDDTLPRYVVARLGEDGPILAQAELVTIEANIDNVFRQVTLLPDGTQIVEVTLTLSHIPDDLRIEMEVIVGGVTFGDGTLAMTLTADDFDESGVTRYQLVVAPGSNSTSCHRIFFHDDGTGEPIGEY